MFELSGPAEGYVSFALSLDKWMVSFFMTCTLTLKVVDQSKLFVALLLCKFPVTRYLGCTNL